MGNLKLVKTRNVQALQLLEEKRKKSVQHIRELNRWPLQNVSRSDAMLVYSKSKRISAFPFVLNLFYFSKCQKNLLV